MLPPFRVKGLCWKMVCLLLVLNEIIIHDFRDSKKRFSVGRDFHWGVSLNDCGCILPIFQKLNLEDFRKNCFKLPEKLPSPPINLLQMWIGGLCINWELRFEMCMSCPDQHWS
jgi:hypothetical protein